MADWAFVLGAGLAAFFSFAWLALAMEDHWEQVYGAGAPSRSLQLMLRSLGTVGLLICGVLCFVADRPSMALLLWVMLMAFGAVTTALTLAWRPRLLQCVWPHSLTAAS